MCDLLPEAVAGVQRESSDHVVTFPGPEIQEDDDGSERMDFTEERFRVDRKKLEEMMQGIDNGSEKAENFFHRVMEETNTEIAWPSKLKIGAKSKKDPHIKVCGKFEDVNGAKEKILEVLDTKRNRVTLKLDVSHTDHSHIIGRGGHNIMQVMEETSCHIHFPDSNKNSISEKSNQVSVGGQPIGVESARRKIRELLPLVISFDLPVTGYLQPLPDPLCPAIQVIQQNYAINISFRQKTRNSATTVTVRGCRKQVLRFRQGIAALMEYLTGTRGSMLPVTLTLEIAAQHHAFVMGRGGINIHVIMQQTGASITFPEESNVLSGNSLTIPGPTINNGFLQGKSTVTITGHFDSVYLAWGELMGYLPLILMFDLKEGQEIDPVQITTLMEQHNVNITVRPKPKQNCKSIVVKGVEKEAKALFMVRRQLLNLEKVEISPNCESHMCLSSALLLHALTSSSTGGWNTCQETVLRELNKQLAGTSNAQCILNPSSLFLLNNTIPGLSPPFSLGSSICGLPPFNGSQNSSLYPLLLNHLAMNNTCHHPLQGPPIISPYLNDLAMPTYLFKEPDQRMSTPSQGSTHSSSNVSSPASSPRHSPVQHSLGQCQTIGNNTRGNSRQTSKSWGEQSWASSASSLDSISETSQDLPCLSRLSLDNFSMSSVTGPFSGGMSSSMSTSSLSSNATDGSSITTDLHCDLGKYAVKPLSEDYEKKKSLANKAMRKPVGSETRVPTNTWSGFGFSKSMPEAVLRDKLSMNGYGVSGAGVLSTTEEENHEGNINYPWCEVAEGVPRVPSQNGPRQAFAYAKGGNLFSMSNYFDSVLPQQTNLSWNEFRDLPQLFIALGVEKYIDLFQQHEIDLMTFLTMTNTDLQQLGITYGSRRKMLLAISELNNRQVPRHPATQEENRGFQAAPGAERRALLSRMAALDRTPSLPSSGW